MTLFCSSGSTAVIQRFSSRSQAVQKARLQVGQILKNDTFEYLATAANKPSFLLTGETPRLIDEWQVASTLWDAVRVMEDKRQVPGQFILTGANTIDRSKILYLGTGRISRMKMYPMSLWESKESNGKILLQALLDDPKFRY